MNSISKILVLREEQGRLFKSFVKMSCLIAFLSNTASAAVWLFDPTVTLSQEYNDNYRLSSDSSNEDEVWTTKLSGELALKGKSERLDVKTILRLDAISYSGDDSNLDDENNQLIALTSAYRVTERNNFSLRGNVFHDTILRTSQFDLDTQDTGDGLPFDPDQDVDENLIQENIERTRIKINPGWNYRLNDKTSLGLRYGYQDLSFDGESGTGLVESERQSISADISRQVTEKDKIIGKVSEYYFRPDNDRDVDTFEVSMGWIHKFSDTFQMDFSAGGRDSEYDNAQKSSDSGVVGNIGATKRTELTVYRFNYEKNVAPSASGNQVEFDEFSMDVRRAITEKLNFNFRGRYLDSETADGSNSNANRKYIRLKPGLTWRFHPSWVAGAFYSYQNNDRDDGGSGDSNSAFVNISWSPPRQF